jgi:outer membrane protein OmpA-like peptidoglycan-associated protein
MRTTSLRSLVAVICVAAMPALAQTPAEATVQMEIDRAAAAVQRAEAAGAPIYAKALYQEAVGRLADARRDVGKKSERDEAQMRAIEAMHAARAAEATARWGGMIREAESLRDAVKQLGGTMMVGIPTADDTSVINRGESSRDRVKYARAIYNRAMAAKADVMAKEDLELADGRLDSAEGIVKVDKNNNTADHLAYTAEMISRRAEAMARRVEVERYIPSLRLERTRLAEAQSLATAARERELREESERRATELRAQLERESQNRKAEQEELARLRREVSENEQRMRAQIETDRVRRLEAERQLDEVRTRYQAALNASADPVEVETLRAQVEDQQLALRDMQERERMSEESLTREIARLRQELERSQRQGNQNQAIVTERQQEIERMNEELVRIRREREAAEQTRAALEKQRIDEIAAAERSRAEAFAESERLRGEVAQERARADQAQAELAATRSEMHQREDSRFQEMQRILGSVAKTRSDERGFIVTLPGIFFDTGKSTLKTGARNVLNRVAEQLKANEDVKVLVEGHTDSVGSDASNEQLSQRRAEAVRDYLTSRGVPAGRFEISAKGESAPLATNDTAAGRQQNRRVELVMSR